MRTARLTKMQQAAMLHLGQRSSWCSVPQLAKALETSEQGAAQTAASLVRRGMVTRRKMDGWVYYRVAS